jgi:hypothetical protein
VKVTRLVLKVFAGLLGGIVLLGLLYVGAVLVPKSNAFVLRSDIEHMAATGINAEIASEICGTKVDGLVGAKKPRPFRGFPEASLLSWRLFFPMEGTALARIIGAGVSGLGADTVTVPCEGTITFRYRFRWEDNGRTVSLERYYVEGPTVVRSR